MYFRCNKNASFRFGKKAKKVTAEKGMASVALFDFTPVGGGSLFHPVVSGNIIVGIFQNIGQVLLIHPMVGIVVGIFVMLPLDGGILSIKMLVLQMAGNGAAFPGLNVGHGGMESIVR